MGWIEDRGQNVIAGATSAWLWFVLIVVVLLRLLPLPGT
jgi:hypothetical protein